MEVCRDVIDRLCIEPCSGASLRLSLPETGCAEALRARTGCDADGFTFSSPDRARVLECRLPLVRESDQRLAVPSCSLVDEALTTCPDLVTFLGGTR